MKHDPYFKYLALVIFAGVVLALINPTPATKPAHPAAVAASTVPTAATKS